MTQILAISLIVTALLITATTAWLCGAWRAWTGKHDLAMDRKSSRPVFVLFGFIVVEMWIIVAIKMFAAP